MAQRIFQQFVNTIEKQTVRLMMELVMPAGTGACTINRGKGVTSAAVTATGVLTITLDDVYFRLLGVDYLAKAADGSTAPVTPSAWLKSETVASTKTVVLQLTNAAGTATAPTTNVVGFIELVLSNTTAL